MIFKKIGYGFVFLGLVEMIISSKSCNALCSTCAPIQLKPCFFLFLFVGIILLVCGLSITSLNNLKFLKQKKTKKKIS